MDYTGSFCKNEKAQSSNPANEEVDFDELMDVSVVGIALNCSFISVFEILMLLSLWETDLLMFCMIQS